MRLGELGSHKNFRNDDDDRGRSLHRHNEYEDGKEPSQPCGFYHQEGGLVMTPDGPKNSFEYDINRNQENSSSERPGRCGDPEFHPRRKSRARRANQGVLNKDERTNARNNARRERIKRQESSCVIF